MMEAEEVMHDLPHQGWAFRLLGPGLGGMLEELNEVLAG